MEGWHRRADLWWQEGTSHLLWQEKTFHLLLDLGPLARIFVVLPLEDYILHQDLSFVLLPVCSEGIECLCIRYL